MQGIHIITQNKEEALRKIKDILKKKDLSGTPLLNRESRKQNEKNIGTLIVQHQNLYMNDIDQLVACVIKKILAPLIQGREYSENLFFLKQAIRYCDKIREIHQGLIDENKNPVSEKKGFVARLRKNISQAKILEYKNIVKKYRKKAKYFEVKAKDLSNKRKKLQVIPLCDKTIINIASIYTTIVLSFHTIFSLDDHQSHFQSKEEQLKFIQNLKGKDDISSIEVAQGLSIFTQNAALISEHEKIYEKLIKKDVSNNHANLG